MWGSGHGWHGRAALSLPFRAHSLGQATRVTVVPTNGGGLGPHPLFLEAWLPTFFNRTSKLRGDLCVVIPRLPHSPP